MSFINIDSKTDIRFSEDQQMIQDAARGFCADKSTIEDVRALLGSEQGFQQGTWDEMIALGWTGICINEQYGGPGLGLDTLIPIAESMGRQLMATPFFAGTLAAAVLQRAGSDAQKEQWLSKIATGSIATLALLDNEDWGDEQCHCELSDAGQLSGHKVLVDAGAQAQLYIVHCRQGNTDKLALVSRDKLSDSAVSQHTLIDETKRAAVVDFSGVQVAAEDILPCDDVNAVLREARLLGALLTSAEAIGATASCLDLTVEYLKTRKQFGKLIGSYQSLKHPAVDILNMMEGAKSQVYHAATLLADSQGEFDADVEIACRMSKATSNDALLHAGDRAVQFHGGMGFTYECDAQLYIRRAQWSQQQFGDSAHHRKRLVPLLLG